MLAAGWRTKVYGWLVHRSRPVRVSGIKASKYVKEHYSDKLLAYFFGYLNHYCQDKYMHPLVLRDSQNISTHTYLEQALDVMYADQYFGLDATQISREKELLQLICDVDEINAFHTYMAAAIYDGYRLPKNSFDKSYWWWSRVGKLTDQPGKARRFWLRIWNIFLSFDIIAFIYKPKKELEGRYDYDKYYRQIDKSNKECLSYMQMVYGYMNGRHEQNVLESKFFNVNCQGQVVVPWEERRAFRRAYRKAPIID